ncbi:PqqD family peptide modification chaperone [Lacrimispora sp.]|uniref:PqqD family peptide modification chaperone n=1 Tax=Lacrimispora sp. TaxID=2719234 RepID=UPI002FDA9F87
MDIKNVKLKPGYILKELGGEFCIFDEKDSQSGSLDGLPSVNETCIFLWNNLERGAALSDLVNLLEEKNEIDEEEAWLELEEFLAKLINGNVVEVER